MKITVITIVYNDCEHIIQTINSVKSQTARKFIEYIVIDGASTDGTSERIRDNIEDIDLYVCEKDSGIYNAMNKGMNKATGDYVLFLNSGDVFSSEDVVEKISCVINKCEKKPVLIYGDYKEIRNGVLSLPIPSRNYNKIWYGPVASHQSTFYDLQFIRKNDLNYDESYKIAADYKLTLEVIELGKGNILQTPICISNFDTSGLSNNNENLGLAEANRARREVLGWGKCREVILTCMLLCARFARHHGGIVYKTIRRL